MINDDGASSVNTEDELISSKVSTETVNSDIESVRRKKKFSCDSNLLLVMALSLISAGIGSLIYTPFDFLLDIRLRMTPGLPPFDWFMDPPDQVLLKVYIFNVTNPEAFMNGTDSKLKVEEIGPIIYREKLIHTNAVFNSNGTFTYTANRSAIFLPEMNTIDLNSTLVMPNLGMLMIATYFFDAPFFTKFGINLMMRTHNSSPLITTTIQNYLWNISDPFMVTARKLAPKLVPTNNYGILSTIYRDFVDNVTVYIGPKFGHENYFGINKFNGDTKIPYWGGTCNNNLDNVTEGICYPQHLTKNDTLKYWRKTMCKAVHLRYTKDVYMYNIKGYKYELSNKTFHRNYPSIKDCNRGHPLLPNGVIDVSPCAYDTSMGASFPHFLVSDKILKEQVDGLKPDKEKHNSYVIVEPNTGIPLHGVARSQVNAIVKDMKGFNEKLQRFSNLVIPIAWLEYNQVGLPSYISILLYFTVVLVPIFQKIFVTFAFVIGLLIVYFYTNSRWKRRRNNLVKNKTLAFERESFLKNKHQI